MMELNPFQHKRLQEFADRRHKIKNESYEFPNEFTKTFVKTSLGIGLLFVVLIHSMSVYNYMPYWQALCKLENVSDVVVSNRLVKYHVYIDVTYNNIMYTNLQTYNEYTENEVNQLKKNIGNNIECYVGIFGSVMLNNSGPMVCLSFMVTEAIIVFYIYVVWKYRLKDDLLAEVDREEKDFLNKIEHVF